MVRPDGSTELARTSTVGDTERTRDADRTRADLLDIATEEFARRGYAGARVDEIAARTRTTKRMIYYYFSGKEGLYIAVLERAYAGIREHEQRLDVRHLSPTEAVRRLVELTFDYHERHPDFIKLVADENLHDAAHLKKSTAVGKASRSIVGLLDDLLAAGRASGEFAADVTAIDLHLMISAFCFFRVANRPTVRAVFAYDMGTRSHATRQRRQIADMVIRYLRG
jgi:AcrR family transcriptional regulator